MKVLSSGLLLLGLHLAACSSDKQPTGSNQPQISNDFESTLGWAGNPDVVTKAQAHSGKYAIYVNDTREFSLTFDAPLSQIVDFRPRSLQLEAWAYLTDERSTGQLGVQIVNSATDNTEFFGDGIKLAEAARGRKKWVKVSKTIVLPDSIRPTQHLKVFLWRATAATPIYVDDITVRIME